jgi:hypothetical protein
LQRHAAGIGAQQRIEAAAPLCLREQGSCGKRQYEHGGNQDLRQ